MLSSSLPLVNTEQGKWPEYRQVLRPSIEEARTDISQYPWRQDHYKKMLVDSKEEKSLGPEWTELLKPKDKKKFLQVSRDLAMDAIVHAPLTYAGMVLRKIGMVLSDGEAGWRMSPRIFWIEQLEDNKERWERHADEMKMLYEMDHDAYLALAAERQQRHPWYEPYVYHFTQTFVWMHTVRAQTRTLHAAWFGLLALFGFLTCLRPSRWRETAPLWLSLGLYLAIIFGIGDAVTRYLQPIEWIGLIFVALGLDWVLQLVWRDSTRAPDAPVASPPAAAPVP
jgi:hypothetical protein